MTPKVRYVKNLLYIVVVGGLLGATVALFPGWRYLWVAAFGAMIGASELVARYRDAPERALSTFAGMFYMAINACASMAALRLMEIFGYMTDGDSARAATTRVLVAGFGAMAFFRSALFMRRVGDQDLLIGPINFLQTILTAIDRAVDRVRGDSLGQKARELMSGVDFDQAALTLVPFCADAMQNMTKDDEDWLLQQTDEILKRKIDSNAKAMLLGIALMKTVGERVVGSAIEALGPIIRKTACINLDPVPAAIKSGDAIQLKATAVDPAGKEIRGKVLAWSTDDPKIAVVDAFGKLRALVTGTTVVRVSADLAGASAPVTVQ